MLKTRYFLIYTLLMTLVVVASNFLVQFPLSGSLFGIALGDLLTWGAFTYPVAFLEKAQPPKRTAEIVSVPYCVGILT